MTRAEKRRKQKQASKLQKQYGNLPPMQQVVVRRTVEMALEDTVSYILEDIFEAMRSNGISEQRANRILDSVKLQNEFIKNTKII